MVPFNNSYNMNEHYRVFPLSNWTEYDIWYYIKKENIEIPSLYFAHKRMCYKSNGILFHFNKINNKNEKSFQIVCRCRTIGDMLTTGLIESRAKNINDIIIELESTSISERGNRGDDSISLTSLEDRKREGYF